jgi:hypothetical protein
MKRDLSIFIYHFSFSISADRPAELIKGGFKFRVQLNYQTRSDSGGA